MWYGLVAAVITTVANLYSKKALTQFSPAALAASQFGLAAVLAGVGAMVLGTALTPSEYAAALATGLLSGGVLFCKLKARAQADISLVATVESGVTPLITILTGALIDGLHGRQIIAVLLLVVGLSWLRVGDIRQLKVTAGVMVAMLGSVLAAASYPFDAIVARSRNPLLGLAVTYVIATITNLIIGRWQRTILPATTSRRLSLAPIVLLAVLFISGEIVIAFAYRSTTVVDVAVLKRLSIPLTAISASWWLGEGDWQRRLISALIVLGAIVVLHEGG